MVLRVWGDKFLSLRWVRVVLVMGHIVFLTTESCTWSIHWTSSQEVLRALLEIYSMALSALTPRWISFTNLLMLDAFA